MIDYWYFGEPGAGFHRVSHDATRPVGVGREGSGDGVAWRRGYLDPSAARSFGRSCDLAARGNAATERDAIHSTPDMVATLPVGRQRSLVDHGQLGSNPRG